MLTIKGKTLITTDWHWGLSNDNDRKLGILVKVTQEVNNFIKDNDVKNIIFMGDWTHNRNHNSVKTMNFSYRCLEALAKKTKFYFIVGNHDVFYRNSSDITSANLFKDVKNVTIISKPTECDINGSKCLLCPWFSDMSQYRESSFDMIFGHFDISHQFVMAQYIENHRSKNMTNAELINKIENDALLQNLGIDELDISAENEIDTFMNNKSSSELIGNWVNVVKEKGTIFAGHIHNRSEFYTNNRKFIFVGSPYQQNLGEKDSVDGFYVLNDDNKYEFHELTNVPHFIDVDMMEAAKDVSAYDFGKVHGNIVHKVYHGEVDRKTEDDINRKIFENTPYEEVNPEYILRNGSSSEDAKFKSDLSSMQLSPMEYLTRMITELDEETLKKNNINDRSRLIQVMKDVYEEVESGR